MTDYFSVVFHSFETNSTAYGGFIPKNFSFSDSSLATIGNVALDLGPDEMIDASYIKRLRQRLRESKKTTN